MFSKIICYYAIYGVCNRNMLGFFQRSYAIMLSMGYMIGICFQRSYVIMLSMGYVIGICWGSFKDHMLLCYLWDT